MGRYIWAMSRMNLERELCRRLGAETRCVTLNWQQLKNKVDILRQFSIFVHWRSSGSCQVLLRWAPDVRAILVQRISSSYYSFETPFDRWFFFVSESDHAWLTLSSIKTIDEFLPLNGFANSTHPWRWQGLLELGCLSLHLGCHLRAFCDFFCVLRCLLASLVWLLVAFSCMLGRWISVLASLPCLSS